MKPVQCDYAHYYNNKYSRRGRLFSDRYKSIASQDQYYLEQLIRYIHLNPVRAGICKTVAALDLFPWSDNGVIMGNVANGFQEVRQVLLRLEKTKDSARIKYREFIEAGAVSNSDDELLETIRPGNNGKRDRNNSGLWVIGDAAFQKSVLE